MFIPFFAVGKVGQHGGGGAGAQGGGQLLAEGWRDDGIIRPQPVLLGDAADGVGQGGDGELFHTVVAVDGVGAEIAGHGDDAHHLLGGQPRGHLQGHPGAAGVANQQHLAAAGHGGDEPGVVGGDGFGEAVAREGFGRAEGGAPLAGAAEVEDFGGGGIGLR